MNHRTLNAILILTLCTSVALPLHASGQKNDQLEKTKRCAKHLLKASAGAASMLGAVDIMHTFWTTNEITYYGYADGSVLEFNGAIKKNTAFAWASAVLVAGFAACKQGVEGLVKEYQK